jgi:hypothetical protein
MSERRWWHFWRGPHRAEYTTLLGCGNCFKGSHVPIPIGTLAQAFKWKCANCQTANIGHGRIDPSTKTSEDRG